MLTLSAAIVLSTPCTQPPEQVRTKWMPVLEKAAEHYDVDPELLDAMIWTESAWRPCAVSRVGAAGLAQIMPYTAKELMVEDPFEPGQAIWGMAWYVKRLHTVFGNWKQTIAAYNAGPTAVTKCQCYRPYKETSKYVDRVIDRWLGKGDG